MNKGKENNSAYILNYRNGAENLFNGYPKLPASYLKFSERSHSCSVSAGFENT